jgi:hypothetical protein
VSVAQLFLRGFSEVNRRIVVDWRRSERDGSVHACPKQNGSGSGNGEQAAHPSIPLNGEEKAHKEEREREGGDSA